MKSTRQPVLALCWINPKFEADSLGYKSGLKRVRAIPVIASTRKTRSAGIHPRRSQFWMAWYETPKDLENDAKPPPFLMANSTIDSIMSPNLQPTVALSQQPRVSWLLDKLQPMVARNKNHQEPGEAERGRFKEALNKIIAKHHPDEHGRTRWLHDRLREYCRKHNLTTLSEQTCGYWVRGEKIPKHKNITILTGALGISRGQLFGETSDPRLADIIEGWEVIPDYIKNLVHEATKPRRNTG